MKEKLTDQLRNLYDDGRKWIRLEIEYARLTAAEKITVFMTSLVLGAICFLLGMVILILLAFSLVDVFKMCMSPALACLTVSGIIILLIVLMILLRRPLLENPISKLISKLILDVKSRDDHE